MFGHQFHELLSFSKDKFIIVQNFLSVDDMSDHFHFLLSNEAFDQFKQLASSLDSLYLQPGKDIWSYIWGSPEFTSSLTYAQLLGTRQVSPVYSWLWKSSCQPKREVFCWLLLKHRLSTRKLLKRKNMFLESYSCVLYHQSAEESLQHLFFHCHFAQSCWNLLGMANLIQNDTIATLSLFEAHLQTPIFMEIVISMLWAIRTQRNDCIFKNLHHSIQNCKTVLRK